MTYIEESLSPGEKILKITQYHWMYLISGILSAAFQTVIAIGILFLAIIYHYYDIVKLPPWISAARHPNWLCRIICALSGIPTLLPVSRLFCCC
jgi:hypothetical protein